MAAKKNAGLSGAFALPEKPKRTAVPEADAQRFERSKPKVEGGGSLRRRAEGGGERFYGYIPPELAERVRLRCAASPKRSASQALEEALTMWLANPPPAP